MAILSGLSIGGWFLKNWKLVAIIIAVLCILGGAVGFGIHYQGLTTEITRLEGEVSTKDVEIGNLRSDVKLKEITIDELGKQAGANNTDIRRYMETIKKLQSTRNDIQGAYNKLLEKISNVKLPTNDSGSLSEPFVLIKPGLPGDYVDLKRSASSGN